MMEYIFIATVFAFSWMILAWVIYLVVKNPALVDLAWTFCVGGMSFIYLSLAEFSSYSLTFVLAAMICWTARLAFLIAYRLIKYGEDGRYKVLDASFARSKKLKYFFFFLMQGFAALILTLPVLVIVSSDSHYLVWNIFSSLVVFTGLIGVVVADIQLQAFIKRPENKGKVCMVGLWGVSRHPNYFFEWVFWMGMMMFALPLHFGLLAVISPLGLILTLLYFTGIPATEAQALRSKGEAYAEYQKTTSAFIPWFRKR